MVKKLSKIGEERKQKEILILNENSLEEIPESMSSSLENLQELYLVSNNITKLKSFANFKTLVTLDLRRNKLTKNSFTEVEEFPPLKKLFLATNPLGRLPSNFLQLKDTLTYLDLGG